MLVRSPIYEQLNDALRRMIVSGEVAAGQQFLTERQVSERFEVSRNTANKALSSLVSEGLLEFRKGVGTFVRGGLDYDLSRLVSFTEKASAAGLKPTTKVLGFDSGAAGDLAADVVETLGVDGETSVYVVSRLRLAERVPVIYEQRVIVRDRVPGLLKSDVKGSLYQCLTEKYALNVTGADELISAVALNREEAEQLEVKAKSPALEVVATGFIDNDVPLWWERTLYRADVYQFRNRIAGLRRSGPAIGELTGFGE